MKYDVCVVGLGYVGLTLATALADLGFSVLGVEQRQDVVDMTNAGKPHFSEAGLEQMLTAVTQSGALLATQDIPTGSYSDIYIITVGTPLGPDGQARLDFIERATGSVAENMHDDALVILRSTVRIGTARGVVSPILDQSGRSYQIAMCPERTLEGRALQELRLLPQIIGADDIAAVERAEQFFRNMTKSTVRVSSLEAAEIVKLVDNTFRDVQFGFANEVARVCDNFGVNAMEVIQGGKLGYPRTNVAQPGLVGGPCLEKDPHILAQSCRDFGLDLDITRAARAVNERQPGETVEFIVAEHRRRKGAAPMTLALLGVAFKGVPATDDLRGAMSLRVLAALDERAADATVRLYDPVCSAAQLSEAYPAGQVCASLTDAVQGADAVIIANNHPQMAELRPQRVAALMADDGFIYDYWNNFSDLRAHELGQTYYAVGNTGPRR